ncbi:heme exporter protein CcmD [Legionella londiniensis]
MSGKAAKLGKKPGGEGRIMTQFLQWLSMGGYSIYVWPAYGAVCIVLVMNLLGIKWQRRRILNKLKFWLKRD